MALDEKDLTQERTAEQKAADRKANPDPRLTKARGRGYGMGLLKGLAVTFKHLFKHNTVIEYPDEKQDLPSRTRGVIALKEENCTVCMLCARECPDWCIYIDSHKEQLPPKREGGRPRKRNVLDRFAIDYALCMYCGICVEVCPYDALFWSREFEYSEYDIRELTHEKEKLSDWMATVLPPPELEVGAEVPGQAAAGGTPAVAAGAAGPGSAQRPAPPAAATAAAQRPEQAPRQPAAAATAAPAQAAATVSQEIAGETKAPHAPGRDQATEEKAPAGEGKPEASIATGADGTQPEAIKSATEAKSPDQLDRPEHDKAATTTEPERKPSTEASAIDAGGAPHTTPGASAQATPEGQSVEEKGGSAPGQRGALDEGQPDAAGGLSDEEKARFQESPGPNVEVPHETPQPVALQPTEDAEAVYQQVLQEQLAKGSSPQVAEARAKVARVKAERGIKRGPTPIQTDKMVPSAPTKGHPAPQEPSGAPEAKDIQPEPGPVAPTPQESSATTEPSGSEASGSERTAAEAPGTTESTPTGSTTTAVHGAAAADAEPAADTSPASPAAVASEGSVDEAPAFAASETEGVAEASAPAEKAGQPEPGAPAAATAASGDDPDAVYERVLAEEKAKGSSDAVAQGRAKAARVKAERAKKAGG